MRVNSQGLIKKLEKLKQDLPQVVEKSLLEIGTRMKNDIILGITYTYSPSWQAARRSPGTYLGAGQPYFKGKETSAPGIFDAIERACEVSVVKTKDEVILGFGSMSAMDQITIAQAGYPYWRLFEYGTIGTRQGGSTTHAFVPMGGGKVGEGVNIENGPEGRRNPGVLPVRLFGDTVDHYQKLVKWQIKRDIQKYLKTIK